MSIYARVLDSFPEDCNRCKLRYINSEYVQFCGITGRPVEGSLELQPLNNNRCPLFDESEIETILAIEKARESMNNI